MRSIAGKGEQNPSYTCLTADLLWHSHVFDGSRPYWFNDVRKRVRPIGSTCSVTNIITALIEKYYYDKDLRKPENPETQHASFGAYLKSDTPVNLHDAPVGWSSVARGATPWPRSSEVIVASGLRCHHLVGWRSWIMARHHSLNNAEFPWWRQVLVRTPSVLQTAQALQSVYQRLSRR